MTSRSKRSFFLYFVLPSLYLMGAPLLAQQQAVRELTQISLRAGVAPLPNPLLGSEISGTIPNPHGASIDYRPAAGGLSPFNAFFRDFGTNGRSCFSCHSPVEGWSINPPLIQFRFNSSAGTSPLFRPVDGAVCPKANVATVDARRKAYALLLNKGLIRIERGIPENAEFELVAHEGTYCNDISEQKLSMFRRPLPTSNLKFQSTIMWDGREAQEGGSLRDTLKKQAIAAHRDHAQAQNDPTDAELNDIVDYQLKVFQAQMISREAGPLNEWGGVGGPVFLSHWGFQEGLNTDPLDQDVFTIFSGWNQPDARRPYAAARSAIVRGQELFNRKSFLIEGTEGKGTASFMGACSSCHNTPAVGTHSLPRFFNTGVAEAKRRTKDLPLYTFRNKQTGETLQLSDPGRGLITGIWDDLGAFKPVGLRGLSARLPLFHDGSAASIESVLNHYQQRFGIDWTSQERADLLAFLKAL